MLKRFASNRVIDIDNKREFTPGFIELENGFVKKCSFLCSEQPFTEWLGGSVFIESSGDGRVAFKGEKRLK